MSARTFTRPGMNRLAAVELRKAIDTRAGLWLQIAVGLLTLLAVGVVVAVGNDEDRTLQSVLNVAIQPATLLLPVIGILLVTSEWSQRMALITFALVPQRGRIVVAKILAALGLGVVVYVLCVVLSLLGAAVAGSNDPDRWDLSAALLGGTAIYLLTAMTQGVAFGAAIRSSAPAIVAFFVLPILFALVGEIRPLHDAFGWLDLTRTMDPLANGESLSATEWARVGTSLLLWMVLPLGIGITRLLRGEVRA